MRRAPVSRCLPVAAVAVIALAGPASAQAPKPQPPRPASSSAAPAAPPPAASPAVQAALTSADAGDAAPLAKLADSGDAEAQVYAAKLFIFGRGKIKKEPAKGCAYAERASAKRGDAGFIVGQCHRYGMVGGKPDPVKAKAAFTRAIALGDRDSKCALGDMLLSEPGEATRGLDFCKSAAKEGDVAAQARVGEIYARGEGSVLRDPKEARRWYEMAAKAKHPDAMRTLGQMYARGEGGKKDPKKAVELWREGDKAGDPLVPILMADQMFSEISGGKPPGPGTYAFRGGVPIQQIGVIEDWYREAKARDPRPDVQKRADYALKILSSFHKAAAAEAKVK